jgi:hypothetical protein
MSAVPPQHSPFAAYPRGESLDMTKIRIMVDGYFGVGRAALWNLLLLIVVSVIFFVSLSLSKEIGPFASLLYLCIPIADFFIVRPSVEKIGFGLGWSSKTVIGYSILASILCFFFYGVIGFALVQHHVIADLRKKGFRGGLFYGKKRIYAFVDELERSNQALAHQTPVQMNI